MFRKIIEPIEEKEASSFISLKIIFKVYVAIYVNSLI